jgi:hypothetical protein
MKGGLGNQLFIYAAAFSLAHRCAAKLLLDVSSGFRRDFFRRKYALSNFGISAGILTPNRSLLASNPQWLWFRKTVNAVLPASRKAYLTDREFPPARFSAYVPRGCVYLDGHWESEKYFKDVRDIIMREFTVVTPHDSRNLAFAERIRSVNAVSVHVRGLRALPAGTLSPASDPFDSLDRAYYEAAVTQIAKRVAAPYFFVFTDGVNVDAQSLTGGAASEVVSHNVGGSADYEDLWLMTQCQHHVIANSTFSWWGAWLNPSLSKLVIAPRCRCNARSGGELPAEWTKLEVSHCQCCQPPAQRTKVRNVLPQCREHLRR